MTCQTTPALKALQARQAELERELGEIRFLTELASSEQEQILPVPHEGMAYEDALELITGATDFWEADSSRRLEFLLRITLCSKKERQAFDTLLKSWVSLLSRRQKRLTKRISRKGGDAGAHALRRAARPVISRLIEIRRETKRVSRLADDIRNT